MRVLLDENLSKHLVRHFPAHDLSTVKGVGWQGIRNGQLIKHAEQAEFQVLLTADQNLAYQQNHRERKISLVVVNTNDLNVLREHLPAIDDALRRCVPNSYEMLELVPFKRARRRPVLLRRVE